MNGANGLPATGDLQWVLQPERRVSPATTPGPGAPGQIDEHGDGVGALLVNRAQERHEPTLSRSPRVGSVPAPDLPIDHGRPDALLRSPVRDVDAVDGEELNRA